MAQVEFIYNNKNIIIICNLNDKMNEIINKFIIKTNIDKNLVYFLYQGKNIDEKLKLEEIIGNNKNIKIKVYSKDELENKNSLIKLENIIDSKCVNYK